MSRSSPEQDKSKDQDPCPYRSRDPFQDFSPPALRHFPFQGRTFRLPGHKYLCCAAGKDPDPGGKKGRAEDAADDHSSEADKIRHPDGRKDPVHKISVDQKELCPDTGQIADQGIPQRDLHGDEQKEKDKTAAGRRLGKQGQESAPVSVKASFVVVSPASDHEDGKMDGSCSQKGRESQTDPVVFPQERVGPVPETPVKGPGREGSR